VYSPEGYISFQQLDSLAAIPADAWNRLNVSGCPFLSHEFLYGLERYGCLDGHGWIPHHLVAFIDNQPAGALPLYVKTNSYGEFVFDWSWADAFARAGGNYYPKLVSAIPFTPVRSPRILTGNGIPDPGQLRTALVNELIERVRSSGMSSFHCLFPEQPDRDLLARHNLLLRKSIQFHWQNRSYRNFDDFLDRLSSKKRKQIKRERRLVREQGIEIEILRGDQISGMQWDTFYEFYCSTFHRRWGSPRLTREFMYSLGDTLPRQTLLILASKGNTYVAGAFAMLDENTLYGRHWGCAGQFANLHFELCYYQTIEYCINQGLGTVDAGVQGEHKLSRGFQPVATWSGHWIRHDGFRRAISDFLRHETPAIDAYIDNLNLHTPYKSIDSG
jgi:hypothetical protein